MYGPYCPIYGFGAFIIIIALSSFYQNPILVFLFGMILTTLLEYITSYVMEKSFGAKWWDYSHMPFNINGRVCLLNSVIFGLLGLFVIYILHPQVEKFVGWIPQNYISSIVLGLVVLVMIDFMSTLNTVLNLKKKLAQIKDITATIAKNKAIQFENLELVIQLEELKKNLLEKGSIFHTRILKAFPNIEFKKFDMSLNELKMELHKRQFAKSLKKKAKKM